MFQGGRWFLGGVRSGWWGAMLERQAGTHLSHVSTVVSAGTVVPAVTDHQNQLELSRNQTLLHPEMLLLWVSAESCAAVLSEASGASDMQLGLRTTAKMKKFGRGSGEH